VKKLFLCALALLAAPILSCSSGDSSQKIEAVINDVPYQTEKFLQIGYTIKTWEYGKDNLELQKIVILDADSSTELQTIDKENIPLIYKDALPAENFLTLDKLTGYYLSLRLTIPLGKIPPKAVVHRLTFKT